MSRFFPQIMQRRLELPISTADNLKFRRHFDAMPDARAAIVSEYYRRAIQLTRRARSVLTLIIVVLIFTAVFIIFAGKIARIGVTNVDHVAAMVLEREELEKRLTPIFEELSERVRMESQLVKPGRAESGLNPVIVDLAATRDGLLNRIANYDREILRVRTTLATREAADSDLGEEGATTTTDPRLVVASTVTRIGVMVIAIYLVQILLNLYRYNTRTAAYYLAHADALMLADMEAETIASLHAALMPNINYGRAPQTLLQRGAEAIRGRFRRGTRNGANRSDEAEDT